MEMMASVQTEIPFRSRKLKAGKVITGIENVDILNVKQPSRLKRTQESSKRCHSSVDDVPPSPTKKAKNISDNIDDKEETNIIDETLPGREKEIAYLKNFLKQNLSQRTSASLYICGQPGTGKTACLRHILHSPELSSIKSVYVNCTMMKSATSIYTRICKELNLKPGGTGEKHCLAAIEKYLNTKRKTTLLVLDEIEQLESKRQNVLNTLFELSSSNIQRPGTLILIGVANALDLASRAALSLRPTSLHFAPYTRDQIVQIFTARLEARGGRDVFPPVALQILAGKIAALSGDVRKALDLGQRVIELARRHKLSDSGSLETMKKDSTITVELKQVLQVLDSVYGAAKIVDNDVEDEAFPMQQKLLLCALMLMVTKGKSTEIIMGKLYDVYKRVCNSRNIACVESSEFPGVVALLEARGALSVGGGRGGARGATRALRVGLLWDQDELAHALRDNALLANVLADNTLLRH